MKKHLSGTVNFIISFIAAFFVFLLALVIVTGIQKTAFGLPPVLFMGGDKTLNIFGETFIIPGEIMEKILSYPGYTFDFLLSFLPETVRRSAVFFTEQISSHCTEFMHSTANGIKSFLTTGI